ncbi:MAG: hypothetical protein OEZ40_05705 [Candidatus Bathyarchaeota archaeon]|nr:hypothetical protein [Candidatus Bathyarchaeota archaeon]
MSKRRKALGGAALGSFIFLCWFFIWINLPKPPYQHVPIRL